MQLSELLYEGTQACYQLAGLILTFVLAITSGLLTGFLIKIPIIQQIKQEEEFFEDAPLWELPETDEKETVHM